MHSGMATSSRRRIGGASSRWRESILSPAPTSEITTTASVSRSQTLSLSSENGSRVRASGRNQNSAMPPRIGMNGSVTYRRSRVTGSHTARSRHRPRTRSPAS